MKSELETLIEELEGGTWEQPVAIGTARLVPKRFDTQQPFGQPHAKLFPYIGRKVQTPGGPGTLLQVFAERVTVLLDSELSLCAFFQPGQVEPLSRELDS
jgi:hypothetical protein